MSRRAEYNNDEDYDSAEYDDDYDDVGSRYDPDYAPAATKGGGGRAKPAAPPAQKQPSSSSASTAAPVARTTVAVSASSTGAPQQPQKQENSTTEAPTTSSAIAKDDVAARSLRPSHDIFNRIMWDPQLSADDFDIGYEDRFAGVLFMPARKFRGPESDEDITIPFHRIRSFRYRGTVIWDRDARIDVLDTICVTATTTAEGGEAAPSSTPALRGGDGGDIVRPTRTPERTLVNNDGTMRVATFNILHPLFDTGSQFTARRIPLIVETLERVNADIVFLQEVTADMFRSVLDTGAAFFSQYFVAPPVFSDTCRTAQATLSKFPILSSRSYATAKQKRVLMNIIDVSSTFGPTADPRYVITANVHLISDMAKEAAARRQDEIKMILALVASGAQHNAGNNVAHEAIIAGDFNFGDQSPDQRLAAPTLRAHGMVDAWRAANRITDAVDEALADADVMPQPDGTVTKPKNLSPVGGFTFDITTNRLASNNSELHRYPRRLDRIFARGFSASDAALFGNTGGASVPEFSGSMPLLPSDHYGVAMTLGLADEPYYWGAHGSGPVAPLEGGGAGWEARLAAAIACANTDVSITQLRDEIRNAKPSHRTAMVISVPGELRAAFDAIRASHDHAYPRWMPHCTLLFPFVDPSFATPAMELVSKLVAIGRRFGAFPETFNVGLNKLDAFQGARKSVVFAKPTDAAANAITALHSLLFWAFPQCAKNVTEDEAKEFHPHFTVGQCAAAETAKRLAEWSTTWPTDAAFTATQIDFIAHLPEAEGHELMHAVDLAAVPDERSHRPQSMASCLEPVPGRKQLLPYLPDDALEKYLAVHTDAARARTAPTHISQLGGMYHVDDSTPEAVDALLGAWATAVKESDATSFFIEEIRGSLFRLYFDVDLPLLGTTAPTCLEELTVTLCKAVQRALEEIGLGHVRLGEAVVLHCHGPWEDASPALLCISSKSGLRLYFQSIFVNPATYARILEQLPHLMRDMKAPLPHDLVVRGAAVQDPWAEVLDAAHSVSWERARLMGTIKRRRIRHLDRRYRFYGVYSAAGKNDSASVQFANGPLEAVLYATMVRTVPSLRFVRDNSVATAAVLQ